MGGAPARCSRDRAELRQTPHHYRSGVRKPLCDPQDRWDNRDSDERRANGRVTPFNMEGAMSLGRFISLGSILLIALVLAACSSNSPSQQGSDDADNPTEVDLSEFPDTGDPVPNQTILTDQWASVGIIFDAEPDGVNLIKHDFGGDTPHIFFSPDVFGAIAVFRFVEPGTSDTVDVTAFELDPWFSPGESAELVGLDEGGTEVAIDTVVPADVGSESNTIRMSIQGTFRVVEWRTHGNPGIAAHSITFEF